MSTNTSLRFLVVAGALLNSHAVSAQNSFSNLQTLVANNTLGSELSGANVLSTPDPVKVETSQTNYTFGQHLASKISPKDRKGNDSNVADPAIEDRQSGFNKDRSLTHQDLSVPSGKVDRPQISSIFSSDLGTLRRNSKISAVPFQSRPDASIEIPVPAPLTQIIPNSAQVVPIPATTSSSTVVPTAHPAGFIAPRSNPIPFTNNAAPTPNFTPFKEPSLELIYPLMTPATITSRFGWRTHPLTGKRRFHSGLDIGAPTGAPVVATESGTIVSAGWNGGYGKAIVIQHNGTQQTLYGHLSEISVQSGQSIAKGTVIGLVGSTGNSTGPHLHFESRVSNGSNWVAVDPSRAIQYAVANLRRSMPFARKDLPQGL
ncbi:M23 family metallopeptidase [Chamaesiphon sp. VAR_48_metabat_135_sub]|uniref:M23 family metallopeptidase n=1 Tax=Chamaesiphon sp. VAR_48_metabat_135_sub TaxID=2964699 RepID=UPI00286C0DC3|nr:M23 family metallopeptidase [Chamaesiphon sp. VAR_48_metabat_135_sub]